MKITENVPPRPFTVGKRGQVVLKDCARVYLNADEQVTFCTESGGEYDVTRKSWGFYATPSLNGRLTQFGLRSALVRGTDGKRFVMLAERPSQPEFEAYLRQHELTLVAWLDDEGTLETIERALGRAD